MLHNFMFVCVVLSVACRSGSSSRYRVAEKIQCFYLDAAARVQGDLRS
jgi:hypothetical protein